MFADYLNKVTDWFGHLDYNSLGWELLVLVLAVACALLVQRTLGRFLLKTSSELEARHIRRIILATPIVAYAMAYYMHLGFMPDSPVQRPEGLYHSRKLVFLVLLALVVVVVLMSVDIPTFEAMIRATPVSR